MTCKFQRTKKAAILRIEPNHHTEKKGPTCRGASREGAQKRVGKRLWGEVQRTIEEVKSAERKKNINPDSQQKCIMRSEGTLT